MPSPSPATIPLGEHSREAARTDANAVPRPNPSVISIPPPSYAESAIRQGPEHIVKVPNQEESGVNKNVTSDGVRRADSIAASESSSRDESLLDNDAVDNTATGAEQPRATTARPRRKFNNNALTNAVVIMLWGTIIVLVIIPAILMLGYWGFKLVVQILVWIASFYKALLSGEAISTTFGVVGVLFVGSIMFAAWMDKHRPGWRQRPT